MLDRFVTTASLVSIVASLVLIAYLIAGLAGFLP
jgi:hypothetical protein